MANKNNRFQQMELYMSMALAAVLLFFILFLIASGFGIIWLKVICFIITLLGSSLCLVYLFVTKLLLKQKAIWMTCAAVAIIVCMLTSLVLGFPSPLT